MATAITADHCCGARGFDSMKGDICPACVSRSPASKPVQKADVVNHPTHYTTGKIEVLDFIEDQKFGYLDGQIIKYVSRYRHKNGLEDLKKAEFYLKRLIKAAESK